MVKGHDVSALLARHTRIGLDTNILIYLVQAHPRYGPWCRTLFRRIEGGQLEAVTSVVSLLEVLVEPYRREDIPLAQSFYALLTTYPGLRLLPMTMDVADVATQLRARYRLSTPDAIQVATAIDANGSVFIGNDKGLKKVREIECLTPEDIR